jgi:hypothetical protein
LWVRYVTKTLPVQYATMTVCHRQTTCNTEDTYVVSSRNKITNGTNDKLWLLLTNTEKRTSNGTTDTFFFIMGSSDQRLDNVIDFTASFNARECLFISMLSHLGIGFGVRLLVGATTEEAHSEGEKGGGKEEEEKKRMKIKKRRNRDLQPSLEESKLRI